jgi:crotonobetainyl-CoA:carnitine CoA-transferase CaiB-like acyl-CoA transferase
VSGETSEADAPLSDEAMADLPLAGLRVVDLGSGPAAGLATMELADFGARVIRYPDPEYSHLNEIPSARMWLRGKVRGNDLAADLAAADVVIATRPNGFTGASYPEIRDINPQVVFCEISGAGADSPLPLDEPVVAAKTGRMQNMTGIIPEAGPHYAAVQVATHATAQNVVSGVLAALYQRRRGGGGQRIATSLLQGLMPYDQGQSLFLQTHPDRDQPDMSQVQPTLNYQPVQCGDGKWLQLGNLLPHLFASFMRVAGLESLLDDLPDEREAVRARILETMQTRTRDEWMDLFVADGGVAAHPYQTADETLADPDMTANGHVVTLDGVTQLGPVAMLTRTPAVVTATAKDTTGTEWCAPETNEGPPGPPLAGVTVLELATIIASPLGASFLADMGARVIKVEAIGGDPFRHMGPGIGAARCNQGKESISVDLKSEEGQKIVRALAAEADILIHNYRPGVPERLGIDYETLSALNPGLIYVSANGYGPAGPGALRPSTHPIPGAAMGGAGYQAGGTIDELLDLDAVREAARRLMRANEVNPDPNTAVVVTAASLLGLLARESAGSNSIGGKRGQQIFVDMFGANAYANFDDLVAYPGKPERASLGPALKGPHPLTRLYEAASGWVYLGIRRIEDWARFKDLTGLTFTGDPFGGDPAEVEAALGALFSEREADDWEALLVPDGIGCVRADAVNTGEFFRDAGYEGSPWMTKVSHAEFGEYYRHKPMVEFENPNTALQGGARAGVDGSALLAELGYAPEEIESLFDRGVLYSVAREAAGQENRG